MRFFIFKWNFYKKNRFLQKNRGQITLEAVLILVVLIGVANLARSYLVEKHDFFSAIIATPWKQIGGMVESGVWGRKNQVRSKHPNHSFRMYTTKPEGS